MKNKPHFRSLFSAGLLLCMMISCRHPEEENLYKASVFTQAQAFTSGIEGPAAGQNGELFAVNYMREGTIGRVFPDGRVRLFLELPDSGVGNGIRFDSRGIMYIADYVGHRIFKVDTTTREYKYSRSRTAYESAQ